MTDIVNRDTRVDWAAILAGAAIATAIGLVLSAFGLGVGLSVTSPYEGEGAAPALYAIGAGLWVLAIQLIAFGIGGYVAARFRARQTELSEHEVDVRDGLHGIVVWAVGVVAAAVISFAVLGGVTTAAESADDGMIASVAASAQAELDQAAVGERVDNPDAVDETFAERRAEVARKLAVISTFVTAASLLIGAVAAFFAAGIGGKHRDESTHLRFFAQRRVSPTYAAHPPVAPTPPPHVPPAR